MPLSFHPSPGTIIICDYDGFRPPEMVKVRPVVVVSPRRRSGQLVTVVPISSVAPAPAEPWHYELPAGAYPPARGPMWVKADLVATVGLFRLDRVKAKGAGGSRTFQTFQLAPGVFAAVQAAIKAALGLP